LKDDFHFKKSLFPPRLPSIRFRYFQLNHFR